MRLWIVGTIVWIGYIAVITFEKVQPYFQIEYVNAEIDPRDLQIKLLNVEPVGGDEGPGWSTDWGGEEHVVWSKPGHPLSFLGDFMSDAERERRIRFDLTKVEGVQGYFADVFRSEAEANNRRKWIARNNVFFALGLGLVPPIVVLAITSVLVWIVIGFAPKR